MLYGLGFILLGALLFGYGITVIKNKRVSKRFPYDTPRTSTAAVGLGILLILGGLYTFYLLLISVF